MEIDPTLQVGTAGETDLRMTSRCLFGYPIRVKVDAATL